jgi:stage II sporulation protein P
MQGIDLTQYKDYDALVKRFYTIDNNTMADDSLLNVDKFETRDMSMEKNSDEPQILIYHTHSQEGYADSVAGDDSTTIMGVGERLAAILEETYGYNVLHHMGKYDVETRDDAYSKALPEIEKVLEENPSIQVVIDLHRDEMAEDTRLVTEVDGRPTAKFMFFNGLSRTKKTGEISYLKNDNLMDNLAFSFKMQLAAEIYYPGVARKIYLKSYRYNMHLKPKTLLIELGAQNNTLEEAMNACDIIAHLLDLVLTGEVE